MAKYVRDLENKLRESHIFAERALSRIQIEAEREIKVFIRVCVCPFPPFNIYLVLSLIGLIQLSRKTNLI